MAKSDESSTIRRSIEFAISYDEPVCDKCDSKLITHSFDGRGWKFWCSVCAEQVQRLTIELLDRRCAGGSRIKRRLRDSDEDSDTTSQGASEDTDSSD